MLTIRSFDAVDDLRQCQRYILREVPGVRARIADEFVGFIQRLRDVQRFLGAEAVQAVGVPLEFGKIVKQRGSQSLRFRLARVDGGLTDVRALENALRFFSIWVQPHRLLQRFLVGSLSRPCTEPRTPINILLSPDRGTTATWAKISHDFKVIFGYEAAYGKFALDHHGQRWRLDAPDGKFFVVGKGVGARQIHAYQPVCPAAATRSIRQRVVVGPRPQGREPLADGFRRE